MDLHFYTRILNHNREVLYRVVFENEKYNFISETPEAPDSRFSLFRDHDEWKAEHDLDPEIKQQAVDALEIYLLKQH